MTYRTQIDKKANKSLVVKKSERKRAYFVEPRTIGTIILELNVSLTVHHELTI